jgi:hypothetical protein
MSRTLNRRPSRSSRRSNLPQVVYESLYREEQAPHRKRLWLPVTATLSTGQPVYIPVGFVTDLATVPRLFWGVISPSGRHDLAVVVHDYLLDSGWSRASADRELSFLLRSSGVHPVKRAVMMGAVRAYAACLALSRFVSLPA